MNRLSEGAIELNDVEVFNNCSYSCYSNLADALNMLTEYENTGLEPEEIEKGKTYFTLANRKGSTVGKVIEYAANMKDLEEQGLLVKLPCKVKDTVYVDAMTFGTNDDIKYAEAEVVSIRITKKQTFVKLRIFALGLDGMPYGCKNYPLTSFGKTVFLTREEAEKALEEQ